MATRTRATIRSAWELFEHELRSVYDGHRRAGKAFGQMLGKAKSSELKKLLREVCKQEDEHLGRCEELFQILDDMKRPEDDAAVAGMIDDLKAIQSSRPSSEVLDVALADVASHLTQHALAEYATLEKLAQRAGIHESTPRVGDIIRNTMKELKKSTKKLQKVFDQLVEELRPA